MEYKHSARHCGNGGEWNVVSDLGEHRDDPTIVKDRVTGCEWLGHCGDTKGLRRRARDQGPFNHGEVASISKLKPQGLAGISLERRGKGIRFAKSLSVAYPARILLVLDCSWFHPWFKVYWDFSDCSVIYLIPKRLWDAYVYELCLPFLSDSHAFSMRVDLERRKESVPIEVLPT